MKKVFSLLMALMLVMSLAVPAAAAENEGFLDFFKEDGEITFSCTPGISNATDLFDEGFKNVMPGDKIIGYVTIRGDFRTFGEDSLDVFMRAIKHHDQINPPVTPGTGNVATMEEFLSQLDLRVYNENEDMDDPIFEAKAHELDGLADYVYLGTFRNRGSIVLRVELDVPIELDNRFAHRVGEVDWEFNVKAWDDPEVDNPKTGDYIMMAVAVMAVSGVALAVLLICKKRKK